MEIVEPPPNQHSQRIPPPPTIFVDDVIDIQTMIKSLERDISKEEYNLKISNNKVKILPTNPEAYRKLTKTLRTLNANFHTYQLKQERPFRVVLRNIHHSADIDELKYELSKLGHEVINALTPLTSAPNHRKPQRNASTAKGTTLPTTKAAQHIKHYTRTGTLSSEQKRYPTKHPARRNSRLPQPPQPTKHPVLPNSSPPQPPMPKQYKASKITRTAKGTFPKTVSPTHLTQTTPQSLKS
ncbi:uncharacterized protein LOC126872223 [Bombus huntii]|uniref:uncharacterized protein LOC126872223 n=1 Tax=Bombus huntii TaxID=85661 RepID=UPI0021AA41DD|nr:uncharacterized protein LOC126872223 [Bombus huntii]